MSDVETALTAEDIFEIDDTKPQRYEVPEWQKGGKPGVLWIRALPASRHLDMRKRVSAVPDDGMFLMVIAACCNEQGRPIFTMEDIEKLKEKNFNILDRLQRKALYINGMGPDPDLKLKNVSGEVATDASPSS